MAKVGSWFLGFLVCGLLAVNAEVEASVPRMAALRSGRVNLRVGPGIRYPVEWILVCKNLPVLVFTEFGDWRRVKLPDGTIGWVLKKFLTGRPYAAVQTKVLVMRKPKTRKGAIAVLMPGVIVNVCKYRHQNAWAKVRVRAGESQREVVGWIPNKALWMHDLADLPDAAEDAVLKE